MSYFGRTIAIFFPSVNFIGAIWKSLLFGILPILGNNLSARQVKISSDEPINYDMKQGTAIARGNALIILDEESYLLADELRYDNRLVEAVGNAQLNRDHLLLVGQQINYNLNTGEMNAENIRLGLPPLYMEAEEIHSDEGDHRVTVLRNGRIYFGEPGRYTFSILARSIKIDEVRRIHFDSASFFLGRHRLFHLAHYRQMAYSPPFYARSRYGHRHDLGFFGEHTFLGNHNEYWRLGGELDYYSQRGLLLGPALEWRGQRGSAKLDLQGGYIHDHGNRGVDMLGKPIASDRYFIDGQYKDFLGEKWTLTSVIHGWSDSDVQRDFRMDAFINNQFPDNFFETNYVTHNGILSLLCRFQPNDFEDVVERLPDLRWDFLPRQLGRSRFYWQGFSDASFLHLKRQDEDRALETYRIDNYYGLTRRLRARDWLSIAPLAGLRTTFYGRTADDRNFTRFIGQIGCDINLNLFGEFSRNRSHGPRTVLYHRLQPSIQYRYLPSFSSDKELLPLEDDVFDTNLPVLDLSECRNVEGDLPDHVLRFGLKNLFFLRRDGPVLRPLAELNFFSDLHLARPENGHRFSDLYTIFNVWPSQFFSFQLFNRFDVQALTLNELRICVAICDGSLWKVALSNEYLQHRTDQYRLSLHCRLNTKNWMDCLFRYDARLRNFVEQRYHFFRRLSQYWIFDSRLTVRSHARREEKFQLGFGLSFVY